MDSTIDYVLALPWKKILVGGAAAFASYAVYFDYKRTHDPQYQTEIRENRAAKMGGGANSASIALPDMNNPEEVQAFFLQEVQKGEELMSADDEALINQGAEHLANAILFCGQSEQLLTIFQQTFPPNHFQLVLSKLPAAKARMNSHLLQFSSGLQPIGSGDGPSIVPIDDDDLE